MEQISQEISDHSRSARRMVLLGPPGAGKSSQGQRLAAEMGLIYLASGALFRAAMAADDALGRQVRQYVENGSLAPDALVEAVISAHLQTLRASPAFILDGFPRNIHQATWLDTFLARQHSPLDKVLFIHLDDEPAFRRLSGRRICPQCGHIYNIFFAPPRRPDVCDEDGATLIQRPDDTPDVVRRRLMIYHQNLDPVIAYYQQHGILQQIDGAGSPDAVHTEILGILANTDRDRANMAARGFAEYLQDTCETGEIRMGTPLPLGAHQMGDGGNFALFSRHATRVYLEFFDHPEDHVPSRTLDLDPTFHRSGDIWHIWVQGLRPGQLYAYRIDGPYQPENGHRFNVHKLLLDPFATAITHLENWSFDPARGYDPAAPQSDLAYSESDDRATMPHSVFTQEHFDWESDRPLRHSWSETVIYETHVRGLTIHPSSGVDCPGTYRGVIEKIPHLQALGITAVELMPVQAFNPNDLVRLNPLSGEQLKNYWGYSPVGFFAPQAAYAIAGDCGQQKLEFKEMVKALHQAGIEVILDVVFNHTAEGNELGPTLCLRGVDNVIFYLLEDDKRFYKDYTGTGNSVNANHPVVRDYIIDALRYWVMEMHVDGFRFDLASVLGRDERGNLLPDAPLLERIAEDPILRDVKIIAEAWDAAGAYQVGSFSECRWAEWNGRYRDEIRRFWRGDQGLVGLFASRISGSSDIYQHSGKGPESSINFITAHDGFTLNDLVSYRYKHNEANGENNRDGMAKNYSENYGVEGETDVPEIEALRIRQIKNLLLTLFISRGVPMLLGGDEFRRTQRGNNNAYCQDNEISWYDWRLLNHHPEIYHFARRLIAFRRAHPVLRQEQFYTDADIRWFSPAGASPNWLDPREKRLGVLILGHGARDLCLLFNAGDSATTFVLPVPSDSKHWHLAADTFLPPPDDLRGPGEERRLENQGGYEAGPRSSVILVAHEMSTT